MSTMGVSAEYCLPVIKTLTEAQKNPEEYKIAEQQFTEMRKSKPHETIASLTQICEGIVAAGTVSDSDKAFVDTTLILLKGTIKEVWEGLDDAQRQQVRKVVTECFLSSTIQSGVRRMMGWCLEQIALKNSSPRESEKQFVAELTPVLIKHALDSPALHLVPVLSFFR